MGRFKGTLDTVERMRRLCHLGGHPEPAWLKAWTQIEGRGISMALTAPRMRQLSKVPTIEYPEDRLIESFQARNPDVKNHPIRLNSWEPHPARLYAWRQLALMRQGWSRRRARDAVQAQYEAEAARKGVREQSVVQVLQRQEEKVLISAINKADRV